MSTRRARIKAVASLPVRRKNNDNNETIKSKVESIKLDTTELSSNAIIQKELAVVPSLEDTDVPQKPSSPIVKPAVESHASPRKSHRAVVTPNLIERSPLTPKLRKPITPRLAVSPKNPKSDFLSPKSCIPHAFKPIESNSPVLENTAPSHEIITTSYKTLPNSEIDRSVALTPVEAKNDYNPSSESEEPVIDGIIPLQSKSVSKPIDLWKNEIISENAEVLFDPIVPLPSPSKVRPKLRPVPRLPLRRNSVQGSASESEDECRRALLSGCGQLTPGPRQRHDSQTLPPLFVNKDITRVRTDSFSSSISHATLQPTGQIAASPLKEKQKIRRSESRKMQALRRKNRRDMPVSRDALTMYDLIFYNPLNNPIVNDSEKNTTVVKEPDHEPEKNENSRDDDPDDPDDPAGSDVEAAAPVPQIKLGPNGEIMLDEQSLVIKQTKPDRALSKSVVHENEWANSGRGKYSRTKRSADWSDAETVRFYRALAAVGTDFTLMVPMFPTRSRRDLKLKFKKEEKMNGAQIDKALRSQTQWDASNLEEEFAKERRLAAEEKEKAKLEYTRQVQMERERIRNSRGFRISRASRATASEVIVGLNNKPPLPLTAEEIVSTAKAKRPYQRRNSANLKALKHRIPKFDKPNELGNISLVKNTTFAQTQQTKTPTPPLAKLPQNIESGSLVVLTVNDPNEPSKKMLQTYISNNGQLTPVALPPTLLNSVMGYMKKGTPSTVSGTSSPQVPSPSSVASQDSRSSVLHINPSPHKKQRHNSYTITQL